MLLDFDALLLAPVEQVFGEALTYTPPGTNTPLAFVGIWSEELIEAGDNADDTGALQPFRHIVEVRDSTFPVPAGPAQGGRIVRGGEAWRISDVRSDGVGSTVMALAAAP